MPHRKLYRFYVANMERAHLSLIGTSYIGMSVTWMGPPTISRAAGLSWLLFINETVVGFAWLVTGVIALTCGITNSKWKSFGHAALLFTPTILSAIFVGSQIVWYLPDNWWNAGSPNGIISAMSFFTWSAWALSGAMVWNKYGTLIHGANKVFRVGEEGADDGMAR